MSDPRDSSKSGSTIPNPGVVMDVQEANAKYLLPAEQLIPEGYKQTEVGLIPAEWSLRPLLTAVQIAQGQVNPVNEPYKSMILIGPVHVESGTGKLIAVQTAAEQRAISGKYLFNKGDVVYGKINPYLKKAILARFDGLCSADMYPLRPAVDISSGFMLAVILGQQFTKYAESVSVRSGMPKINRVELADFNFPCPPTKIEQEAIAEALSDADALIEALEQLVAKKRQLKQGTMQELLTGKRRLPGFSGQWEMRTLGELASIQRGASPRPIDSPIWFDENSSVGWVRISDVTKSKMYLRETMQRLSQLGIQHSRPVSQGSLIMSICATVGRPIITMLDTCIHDGFVVFDSLRCDQYFLYYILSSIESDWSRHGQTGSQMNLNTGLINRTEVSVPAMIEEQTAIAQILTDMDAEITELETKLAKSRAVKQGMMQQLLTGKIRLV
jgi:type I restriction enzyme S subunit